MNVSKEGLEWARARAQRRKRSIKELISILKESTKRIAETKIDC